MKSRQNVPDFSKKSNLKPLLSRFRSATLKIIDKNKNKARRRQQERKWKQNRKQTTKPELMPKIKKNYTTHTIKKPNICIV